MVKRLLRLTHAQSIVATGLLCAVALASPAGSPAALATEAPDDRAPQRTATATKSNSLAKPRHTRTVAAAVSIVPRAKPRRAKPPRSPFGVLGSIEFKTGKLSAIREWARVRKRIDRERAKYVACDRNRADCPANLRSWRAKLTSLKGASPLSKLRKLNRFINASVTYRNDDVRFGRSDYWATPRQILGSAGDCEDYAIAKFFSLLDLGFTNDQMRIVVVKDSIRRVAHAVLAVNLDNKTYIMDSLFDEPVPHQYVLQYDPVYSVNLTTRWAHIVTPELKSKFVSQFVDGRESSETKPERNEDIVSLAN